MPTNRLTKLDAINAALTAIGSSPISALSGALPRDASIALLVFEEVDREIQGVGWHHNTDYDVELSPDITGLIAVPPDALSIDTDRARSSADDDVVERDGFLWSRRRNSSAFTGPVRCEIVRRLNFEFLPSQFQSYIKASLARELQERVLGDTGKARFLLHTESRARAEAVNADLRASDQTHLDNNLGYDVVGRRGRPYYR